MMGRDHALTGGAVFAAIAPQLPATATAPLVFGIIATAGAAVLPDIDHPDSTVARTFGFATAAFAWIVNKLSGGHRHGTHSIAGIAAATTGAWYAGKYQASGLFAGGHAAWSLHLLPAGLYMTLIYAAVLRVLAAAPVLRGGRRGSLIGGHRADLLAMAGAAATLYQGTDLATLTAWHVPLLALVTAAGCASHVAGDELTHGGCPLLWPFSLHEFHLLPRGLRITTNKIAEHRIVSPLLLLALGYCVLWRDTGAAGSIRDALAAALPPFAGQRPRPGPGMCAGRAPPARDRGRAGWAVTRGLPILGARVRAAAPPGPGSYRKSLSCTCEHDRMGAGRDCLRAWPLRRAAAPSGSWKGRDQ